MSFMPNARNSARVFKCRGGDETIDNLRVICKGCNSSMATINMIDFCKNHYTGSKERLKLN